MKISDLPLKGLKLVELKIHGDSRGFFVERYREDLFRDHGIPNHFVQDNQSRSSPGILRGLHYQRDPAQGKLVGVSRGKIWDVALDIRPDSPTFGKHIGIELSDENGKMLWIPYGFAHGFCVLGDGTTDVVYKMDGFYNPKTEGGILWNDPALDISWPVKNPIISDRDTAFLDFAGYARDPISAIRPN